jgi:hypothetical protein
VSDAFDTTELKLIPSPALQDEWFNTPDRQMKFMAAFEGNIQSVYKQWNEGDGDGEDPSNDEFKPDEIVMSVFGSDPEGDYENDEFIWWGGGEGTGMVFVDLVEFDPMPMTDVAEDHPFYGKTLMMPRPKSLPKDSEKTATAN